VKKTVVDSPKKSSVLPIILSILAILLLITAFLGSFAYSFVKTRIINKAKTTGMGALRQFGGGALGNVPGGDTIKTKAEGIATCKKSGVDYCFPMVALSFNDMSVCKEAPDPKACESAAEEFKKDFEGGRNGGGEREDVITPPPGFDQDSDLQRCQKGTTYRSSEGNLVITGKERLSIEGTSYDICCWETKNMEDASHAGKACEIIGQPNSMILYKVGDISVLESVSLTKDGKDCTYIYDEGNIVNTSCQ
jgi:hypothetical protein